MNLQDKGQFINAILRKQSGIVIKIDSVLHAEQKEMLVSVDQGWFTDESRTRSAKNITS